MTEPNVFGNEGIAKFLFETGNTEYKALWMPTFYTGTYPFSLHESSSGTANGVDYIVPTSRIYWMLGFQSPYVSADAKLNISSNTSADTETGGTSLFKAWLEATVGWDNGREIPVCLKFVAGEYITPFNENAQDIFIRAWGIETDD